jgi:hypothetical protein
LGINFQDKEWGQPIMWKVYFNLNKPSPLEANSEVNGMKVSVSQRSKQLIVENIDVCDETDAHQKALTTANQFLDTLSWKYRTTLAIDEASRCVEHISPSGQKQLYVTVADSFRVGEHIRVVKKDSSGNIIEVYDSSKPGKIEVKPSEAASHFRHAHLTDDPFNRFHDLYLAAENIASKIQGLKGLNKSAVKQLSESGQSYEEGLLRLALDECFSSNLQSLNQVAKKLPDFDDAREVVPQVAKMLYTGYRCQLNYSKALGDKKIPFNPEDKKEVGDALPLMEFVARSLLQYEENSLLVKASP